LEKTATRTKEMHLLVAVTFTRNSYPFMWIVIVYNRNLDIVRLMLIKYAIKRLSVYNPVQNLPFFVKMAVFSHNSYSYRKLNARNKNNYLKILSQKTGKYLRTIFTDNFFKQILHISYDNYIGKLWKKHSVHTFTTS